MTKQMKVWWTEPRSLRRNMLNIHPYVANAEVENFPLQHMADLSSALQGHRPVSGETMPVELRFLALRPSDRDFNLPDAFSAWCWATIVSQHFVDTVSHFDLGETQVIELPLYSIKYKDKISGYFSIPDRDRRDPRRWYLFNVTNRHFTLRPDHCENIRERKNIFGQERPFPSYHFYEKPTIAVEGDTVKSLPDVWYDPSINDCLFFSDRLKKAIKKARLDTPYYVFKSCVVV